MKPKEEEKRRKKEMLFKRSFSNTAREGHILGVRVISMNVCQCYLIINMESL